MLRQSFLRGTTTRITTRVRCQSIGSSGGSGWSGGRRSSSSSSSFPSSASTLSHLSSVSSTDDDNRICHHRRFHSRIHGRQYYDRQYGRQYYYDRPFGFPLRVRYFGISRHPDPLAPPPSKLTADDDDDDVDREISNVDDVPTEDDPKSSDKVMGGGFREFLTADDLEVEYEGLLGDNSSWGGSGGSEREMRRRMLEWSGVGADDDVISEDRSWEVDQHGDYDGGDYTGDYAGGGGVGDYFRREAGADGTGDADGFDGFDGGRGGGGRRGGDTTDPLGPIPNSALSHADHQKRLRIKEELDRRTGRLWTDDWVISDEEWMTPETWEDIEEWRTELVTRKTLESLKLWEGGVPTLHQLSQLPLPESPPPHPGHTGYGPNSADTKAYAKHRKGEIKRKIMSAVQLSVGDELKTLVVKGMNSTDSNDDTDSTNSTDGTMTWEQKQEIIDSLFESIEDRVREREPILGKLPDFGDMCERGLEQVLRMVQRRLRGVHLRQHEHDSNVVDSVDSGDTSTQPTHAPLQLQLDDATIEEILDVMNLRKEAPVPVFMDLLATSKSTSTPSTSTSNSTQSTSKMSKFFTESNSKGVPNLIYPLDVHPDLGVGRMVEEWELAANKDTKRIMMREGMRQIAGIISSATEGGEETEGAARVLVVGRRGVGKTATLAGIVASARQSGHITIYHPDGDRLRSKGYYVEPSNHPRGKHLGLYDLPVIAKEFCGELLASHGEDLRELGELGKEEYKKEFRVTREEMGEFFTEDHVNRVFQRAGLTEEGKGGKEGSEVNTISLDKLLEVGKDSTLLSSSCYSLTISKLMNQSLKPLTIVMDEFNCYYDHGHYYHIDYHENVADRRNAIPLNRITILKPFLDAMGLYPEVCGTNIQEDSARNNNGLMKRGAIIVATSESRAVHRKFTEALTNVARRAQGASETSTSSSSPSPSSMHVIEVRRFSPTEVQHILYNFDAIGIGRLRFDKGNTVLNPEEVAYLRMVSGGIGQPLLDACMLP